MKLFRFGSDPRRPAAQEFAGTGGLVGDGRWHFIGTPCVYTATCEPLALLEKLIHRGRRRPRSYSLYIADLPDSLAEELQPEDYPIDWRSIYPPASTQRLGNDWLIEKMRVGLIVPSVLLSGLDDPRIKNCLLNPLHPDFDQVTISGPIAFGLDPRF